MKYWWLEKYRNFKIIQINSLANDVDYFLTMPKNYIKQYQLIKNKNINVLLEEELLIALKNIVITKNIKNNDLNIIIDKLLKIPDNSFPCSDYSLIEMLEEIKNLKYNLPYKEKLTNNNIAVCYNCLNIFYVDKINRVDKNNLCLCSYCLKHKLYFDNDYIPMNYTFLKLAKIYYGTSNLGCSFKNIQVLIKKCILTSLGDSCYCDINFSDVYFNTKLRPIDEKIINRRLMLELYKYEDKLMEEVSIYISNLYNDVDILLLIVLLSIMELLANTIYIKKIKLIFESKKNKDIFDGMIKVIKTF